MPLLSKSDFILAQDCLAKLYFKRNGYASTNDENLFLQSLAKMGNVVGEIAKVQFPGGTEIGMSRNPMQAVDDTATWLKSNDTGILYEATFSADGCYARVDVLVKIGSSIELIEVKSSGVDASQKSNRKLFNKAFDSKLNDLTFQYLTAKNQYPEFTFEPFLALVDKDVQNTIPSLYQNFKVVKLPRAGNFQGYDISYLGNQEELKSLQLLHIEPCMDLVSSRLQSVGLDISRFIEAYEDPKDFERFKSPLGSHCSKCEFRTTPLNESGIARCWGNKISVEPHILDVAKDAHFSPAITELIQNEGASSIMEIPEDLMYTKTGTERVNGRPLFQRSGESERIDSALFEELDSLRYPLFFIDFETIRPAVPYHLDLYPYDIELFQWSVHKQSSQGGKIEHFEFLNDTYGNPNDAFIRSLRDCIGNSGTILTWSSYENTQIRKYLNDLSEDQKVVDPSLLSWLTSILKDKDGGYRQVDMHDDWIKKMYFHKDMKGRTSIKVVLPAILSETNPQANIDLLTQVGLYKVKDGGIVDPYKLLERVSDGGKAMEAYEELICSPNLPGSNPTELRKQLLEYCRLDTLSMVVIFNYLNFKRSQR